MNNAVIETVLNLHFILSDLKFGTVSVKDISGIIESCGIHICGSKVIFGGYALGTLDTLLLWLWCRTRDMSEGTLSASWDMHEGTDLQGNE